MNIKYKILSKDLYKLVKKEEYWDDKDLDIVDKFAKMIKDEVAKVKRAEIYQAKKAETPVPVINNEETIEETVTISGAEIVEQAKKITDATELLKNIIKEPEQEETPNASTLFERIYDEDSIDAKILADIEKDQLKTQETVVEKDPNALNRYIIHVETYGDFIQDTKFQKFISSKRTNKDFMTDQVLNTLTTYVAVVDEINEGEIRRKIVPMLDSVHLFKIIPVASNFVLPQFASVWNHQTLI